LQCSALRRPARGRRDARRHIGATRGAEQHLVRRSSDGPGADRGRASKRRDRADADCGAVHSGHGGTLAERGAAGGAGRHRRALANGGGRIGIGEGARTSECSRIGAVRDAARADRG